jgi:hypothetical protein
MAIDAQGGFANFTTSIVVDALPSSNLTDLVANVSNITAYPYY